MPRPRFEKDPGRFWTNRPRRKTEAETKEREAGHLFREHEAFSWAVTGFQIGISLAAISLLTKRRGFRERQEVVPRCPLNP